MMKIVALLLAIVASFTIHPSEGAAVACFKYWTRAEAGTSGTQVFTGITNGTTTENYNNPLFYTLANAKLGFKAPIVNGRLSGKIPTSTYIGTLIFDFFQGKDQIKITFTKKTGAGVITSGKGCYLNIAGTSTRKQIGTTLPKVFEWTFCPTVAPKCKALRG